MARQKPSNVAMPERRGKTVWIYEHTDALLHMLAKGHGWSKVDTLDVAIRFALSAKRAGVDIRQAYRTARRKPKEDDGEQD